MWTSHPRGSLAAQVKEPSLASRYRHGTRTADFHVCSRCAVVPVVTCEIDGWLHAVVNVNTFDNVDATLLRRAPVSFDGEERDTRLARRKRNWIADVRFLDTLP